jgi:transcriptional regulator with AAA-type ATPase domain
VAESVVLESGRTVRLRATRILAGEEVAGIVLLLDDEPGRSRPAVPGNRVGGPAPPPPAPGGRSPAWVAACGQIGAAFGRGDRLLVMGEPGTGRSTLVAELFGRRHPAGAVVAGEVEDVVREALPESGPARTLVVLRHLDRIGADLAARLPAFLGSLDPDRHLVAATLSDTSTGLDLPFRAVLGEFQQAVTLPPLRFRTDDLPGIVASLLTELAPDRRVRLHPEAGRLIGRHPWPGNLVQLREALAEALRKHPVGEIRPEDLPAWCRTSGSRHTLTPLESVERDAIVAALARCRGNRARAAASLGMSRSSLYRKITTYAITDA